MNRNKIMEWLRRNGWELLTIGSIAEHEDRILVIGHHVDTHVTIDIKKSELDQIELRGVPEDGSKS